MLNKTERVLCAAIWIDDGEEWLYQPKNIKTGVVLSGWRHGSVLQQMRAFGVKAPIARKAVQGFLTSDNRFLDRVEARRLVLVTGQLIRTQWGDELYSEDLY